MGRLGRMRPRAFHVGAQHLLERDLARRAVSLDTSVELMLERSKRHVGERVLATIVATAGSTYRKAVARMLLMADGNYSGLLSGGCFEADLVAHAREVFESDAARLVE
jgi:xanthine/CO dehydrogenase XdhC/CoxF family maturation factor